MVTFSDGSGNGKHKTVTTVADPKAPHHPDQWWVADFTYVWTLAGFVYVSFVTEVISRRILGWRVASYKTTALVLSALDQALFTRRRHNSRFSATGLVHRSDAGSQYTSITFGEALIEAGISPSIGTVGDALDSALQESTIGLYKTELIEHGRATSSSGPGEVERETASWVRAVPRGLAGGRSCEMDRHGKALETVGEVGPCTRWFTGELEAGDPLRQLL